MKKLKTSELGRPNLEDYHKIKKMPITIVLDNIRSLNNIGSIFRTSDAFLAEKIMLCGITASPPHREIHKTALGSTESVPWQYCKTTGEALQKLKAESFQIIGIEQTDESIALSVFSPNPHQKYALVFGNEVKGLSDDILGMLDICLEIPQGGIKHSLNVSVSAGIVIYQFFQKLQ